MELSSFAWLIVAFLIGLIVKDYLPSYVRKKGENLATKEDIAAITHEVESVKSSIDRQSQLFGTKQELLMQFYDHVTELYYERLAVNFGDFPNDEGQSLFDYHVQFHKSIAEIVKAYQRLVIFLPPESTLLEVGVQITNCALESRKVLVNRFGKVKITLFAEHRAHRLGDDAQIQLAANMADDANSKFWQEMRPCVEDLRDKYQVFLKEMNDFVAKSD